MTSIVAPVYKSIVRATMDMIDEINATGTFPVVLYHDWESRADEVSLPKETLVGVEGFSFTENQGRWLISFGFGISSFRDANLMIEIELIDFIQQKYGEQKKINLLSMVDASIENEMVVTAFQILPMAQSEQRNYRTIGVELKRTGT
jgi:hypothetical protein